MKYLRRNVGEIAIGTLLTMAGLALSAFGLSYANTEAKYNKVDNKIDKHISDDKEVYERITRVETKIDLLLKDRGITTSEINKNTK